MNPITHALTGWVLGQSATRHRRDAWLVTAGTLVPDLDGLGILAEWATAGSSAPLHWYTEYHHTLGHNLFAGLAAMTVAAVAARDRLRTSVLTLIGFHLHLLQDIVGSGGPDGERWTTPYLWPWRPGFVIDWPGQWPIEAWPNLLLTLMLLLATLWLARNRGYSPLSLFSERADNALLQTLRQRFPLDAEPPPAD